MFLEKLGETVRLLTERCLRGNDANYGNITSLEEVIFQFGYLRIHMDDVTFQKVISNTSEMIGVLHRLNLDILYKQRNFLAELYKLSVIWTDFKNIKPSFCDSLYSE